MPPNPKPNSKPRAKPNAAPAAKSGARPPVSARPSPGARRPDASGQSGAIVRSGAASGTPTARKPTPDRIEMRRRDPHLGLRFWIQLGQIEVAGFRECTGLEIKTETVDYNEGGLNNYAHRLPVRVGYSNITLKRGMDFGLDLFNWYYAASLGMIKRQNISIVLYSNSVLRGENDQLVREIVQRWDLQNAFPCRWSGPELNAERGAIAIETLEIAHEGLLPTSAPANRPTNSTKSAAKSARIANSRQKDRQFY